MPSILAILLLGSAGAVLWRREHVPQDPLTGRDDVPVRLLQWAVGLLPSDRVGWGQAMLGELDRIEGRSKRWRFAVGCLGGLLVLRPRRWRRRDGRGAGRGGDRRRRAVRLGVFPLRTGRSPLELGDGGDPAGPPGRLHPRRERSAAPARCGRARASGRSRRPGGLVGVLGVHVRRDPEPDHRRGGDCPTRYR